MRNFIQEGNVIAVPATLPIKSGDGVMTGALFGVAAHDAESGELVSIATSGVFWLPKTAAQAWNIGQAIYWDAANGEATTDSTTGGETPTAHTLIGHATEPAANPSIMGAVRLSI